MNPETSLGLGVISAGLGLFVGLLLMLSQDESIKANGFRAAMIVFGFSIAMILTSIASTLIAKLR